MADELSKDILDRCKIGVKVQVFFLYIKQERVLGIKILGRAVAFVAFGHEIFAACVPMRIAAENRNLSTDVMRRVQPAFPQDVRGHRRGRGFAVHPHDENAALAAHNSGQRLGPAHHRFADLARARQNGIFYLDRGGKNNQLGVARVLSAVFSAKI